MLGSPFCSLPPRLRNVPDPAFWRGLSGVAYALLVYADALDAFQ